jgi:UDP-N-acetylglucosamine 2-epimerase (non-hydrolysing)
MLSHYPIGELLGNLYELLQGSRKDRLSHHRDSDFRGAILMQGAARHTRSVRFSSKSLPVEERLIRRDKILVVKHVLHVVGARPNLIKAAPVLQAVKHEGLRQTLVHTGQHYDRTMSEVFFKQLDIPEPDFNLDVRSGTHAEQTAEIMRRFEPVVLERRPDIVLVYGDVNSTMAAALVCSKLLIPIAHVEAGLRSFDRTMPEEINRIVTDRLADLLFTPSEDADRNLIQEGIPSEHIHRVGNVMIDSLIQLFPAARNCRRNGLPERFALVTLHRPANVDDAKNLHRTLLSLLEVSKKLDVIFPVHPRTRRRIAEFGLKAEGLHLLEPMPYIEFLSLESRALVVLTDSGGIQEETTYLGVPCLTLRTNTERPITVELGTNTLVGDNKDRLNYELGKILAGEAKKGVIPPLWDGQAGARIGRVIAGLV